jgi:hypothetical protein
VCYHFAVPIDVLIPTSGRIFRSVDLNVWCPVYHLSYSSGDEGCGQLCGVRL